MTALKILVGCVSVAALAVLVAIPYKHEPAAAYVCVAAAIGGALAAFSARFARAIDAWGEKRVHRSLALVLALALLLLVWLPALPERVGRVLLAVGFGAGWSLITAWLAYKVVQTLRGSSAAT